MANAVLGGASAFFGYGGSAIVDASNGNRHGMVECTSYTLNAGVTIGFAAIGNGRELVIIARDFIRIAGTLNWSGAIDSGKGSPIGGNGANGAVPNGGAGGIGAIPYDVMTAVFGVGLAMTAHPSPATGMHGGNGSAPNIVFNGGGGGGGGFIAVGGAGGNGSGILGIGSGGQHGKGGGTIILMAPLIIIESTAVIDVRGAVGSDFGGTGAGGGGGGSGGLLGLVYQQLQDRSNGAAFLASGGNGGAGGGSILFGIGGVPGGPGNAGGNGVNGGGAGGGGAGGLVVMRGI